MNSKFSGSVLGYIGVCIVAGFLTTITLGLATPWVVCYVYSWVLGHSVIDGHKLVFKGTGAGLFGNYIKWWILSIITIGIYALWVPTKVIGWVVENTHTEA